jgi:hypothetical protein
VVLALFLAEQPVFGLGVVQPMARAVLVLELALLEVFEPSLWLCIGKLDNWKRRQYSYFHQLMLAQSQQGSEWPMPGGKWSGKLI